MSVELGKNLIALLGLSSTGKAGATTKVTAPKAYKAAGYASIPYEKQPVVKDIVPTKYSDGTPFWSDYDTPVKVFVA